MALKLPSFLYERENMVEGQMQMLWKYIEDQLYALSPEIAPLLPPRASETLIQETEKKLCEFEWSDVYE
jgi:hypothetical protein